MEDSGQPKLTNYLYDGFSFNPLQETANPGQTTHLYRGAGYLTETRDVQSSGTGQLYYRQPNWRGDVALISNNDGTSVHDYLYTAYGQLLDNNGKLQDSSNFTGPHNHYTLTGKELDTESGLYYFGARYYAATQGNWQIGRAHV